MTEKKCSIADVPFPSHADAINRVMRDHPEAEDIVIDWNAKEARFAVPDAPAPETTPPAAAEEGGHTPSASGAELLE